MNKRENFEIEQTGDFCKITVKAPIAAAPVTIVLKEIIDEEIQKSRCNKILFDLKSVEFVDSSFIGAIVYAYKILYKSNGKISCVVSSSSIYDRFLISQLDKLFLITSDIEQAEKELTDRE